MIEPACTETTKTVKRFVTETVSLKTLIFFLFYDILFVLFRYSICIYTTYFGSTLASTGMIRFYKEESTQLIIVRVTNTSKWLYRLGRVTHLLTETMIYTNLIQFIQD